MTYDLFVWDRRLHGEDGARLYAVAAEDELRARRASRELSELQRAVQAHFGGRLSVPLEHAAAEHGAFIVSVPFTVADELVGFVTSRLGRSLASYDPQLDVDGKEFGDVVEGDVFGDASADGNDAEATDEPWWLETGLSAEQAESYCFLVVPREPAQPVENIVAALRDGRFLSLAYGSRLAEMQDVISRLPAIARFIVRRDDLRGRAVVVEFPWEEHFQAMATDDFEAFINWTFDPDFERWESYRIDVAHQSTSL